MKETKQTALDLTDLVEYREELLLKRDILALKLEALELQAALKNFEKNGDISTEKSTGNSV